MYVIRNMTVKRKLIAVIMLTCVIALLSAGAAFILWQWRASRTYMIEDLSVHAEMIAEICTAAVAFQDAEDAKLILKGLHVKPSIVFAGVYSKDGTEFASYYGSNVDAGARPPLMQKDGHSFADGYLTVSRNIILDGESIGAVCLRSDLTPMRRMLMRTIRITVAVLVFAVLIAYLVSSRLQMILSGPILNLADVARAVSQKKDYSKRALKQSNDEVGSLIDAFNEMLEQIQSRDWELVQAKIQLETRVQQRTAELSSANASLEEEIAVRETIETRQRSTLSKLESANQELKDFAYIVSHDLKAPLRGIKTLAEWISSDYADKIDEDGREQMGLLSNRVDRMHNLIDGILQYSRVGRVKENLVAVNLNQLVPEIIDALAPPENISITTEGELPMITCEPTRITQVFQNLLSNAVKYMDKPRGIVKIGCAEEDGYWKFSISDNGPGIEERYFEKIFQMFQTLAARDEFESTGVGLTVVKKIVEMYGGKIWVESKVGRGSTFLFTLPKQQTETDNAGRQADTAH